jgi:hypothetical protein
MASGIFVNGSGRILVSLFFWIGKRVIILLPIFFYHKLAQSLHAKVLYLNKELDTERKRETRQIIEASKKTKSAQ